MKIINGVYFILNQITNKFYIGSSNNIKKRWKAHMRLLNKNNHHSIHLQNAWNKYGFQSFSFGILEECFAEVLIEREQFYLDEMKPEYNMYLTADSPASGSKRSEEWKNVISVKMKGDKNPFFGKTHSDEVISYLREINIGKKHSKETKEKIKNAMVGDKNHFFGKKHSKETIERISGYCHHFFGKHHSSETKQKISNKNKGENNFSSKLTEQEVIEIREKYASGKYTQKELGKEYNVDQTTVSSIVLNKSWRNSYE